MNAPLRNAGPAIGVIALLYIADRHGQNLAEDLVQIISDLFKRFNGSEPGKQRNERRGIIA